MDYSEKSKEELIKELQNLKENQKNMSMVLENIKEMFYQISFDEKGNKKFEYLSPQIIDVLGLSQEEYIENLESIWLIGKPVPTGPGTISNKKQLFS